MKTAMRELSNWHETSGITDLIVFLLGGLRKDITLWGYVFSPVKNKQEKRRKTPQNHASVLSAAPGTGFAKLVQ